MMSAYSVVDDAVEFSYTEDHKFSRADGRNADHADKPATVDVVLSHGGTIAPDEEGIRRFWCQPGHLFATPSVRKLLICPVTDAHRTGSLGSKTTHWVPLSIERSRYVK